MSDDLLKEMDGSPFPCACPKGADRIRELEAENAEFRHRHDVWLERCAELMHYDSNAPEFMAEVNKRWPERKP